MSHRGLDEFIERARGLRRQEELDRNAIVVLDAFETAGVPSLLLKGPALARMLYTEAEHRGYSDIDLLVPASRLGAAREALIELGYTKAGEGLGIDDVAGIQHAEIWARRAESGPLWIDLHWRLGGCEAGDEVVWDVLAEGRMSINLQGHEVAVLGTDGLAFHLAMHAAQHGPRDAKAMGDLARGVQRWPVETWRSAAQIAREVQAVPNFAAGLRLLPSGAQVANQLDLPQRPQLEWEILHREARPRGTFHLRALTEARGPRQHANVLRRSVMPTQAWITWEFPWAARNRPLLIAAYVWHVLRAPAWAMRAWRYLRSARRVRG